MRCDSLYMVNGWLVCCAQTYLTQASTLLTREQHKRQHNWPDHRHHNHTPGSHRFQKGIWTQDTWNQTKRSSRTFLLFIYCSAPLLCVCAILLWFWLMRVLDHAYSWLGARLGLFVLYFVLCPVLLSSLAHSLGVLCFFHLAVILFASLLLLDIL